MRFVFIVCIALACITSCYNREIPYSCDNEHELHELINHLFKADSSVIQSGVIQEEVYFEPIRFLDISIYGAETKLVNFKVLKKGDRFDNWGEIEIYLKEQSKQLFDFLQNNCKTKNIDELNIIYRTHRSRGHSFYIKKHIDK